MPQIPRLCAIYPRFSPRCAVDGHAYVSYVNPAFARLVGKEVKELIGRPFAEAVPEGVENGCLALLDRVFRTGTPENLPEQEHRQSHPIPVYWSYAMWAILGADEQPMGVDPNKRTDRDRALPSGGLRDSEGHPMSGSAARTHVSAESLGTSDASGPSAGTRQCPRVLSHELRNPLAAFSTGDNSQVAMGIGILAERPGRMMERQGKQMVQLGGSLAHRSGSRLENWSHKQRVSCIGIGDAREASPRASIARGHKLSSPLPPVP